MSSETVDPIDLSHPPPSWAGVHSINRHSLSSTGIRPCNFSMRGKHLAYAATQGMKCGCTRGTHINTTIYITLNNNNFCSACLWSHTLSNKWREIKNNWPKLVQDIDFFSNLNNFRESLLNTISCRCQSGEILAVTLCQTQAKLETSSAGKHQFLWTYKFCRMQET